jgi:hypothetical protein
VLVLPGGDHLGFSTDRWTVDWTRWGEIGGGNEMERNVGVQVRDEGVEKVSIRGKVFFVCRIWGKKEKGYVLCMHTWRNANRHEHVK